MQDKRSPSQAERYAPLTATEEKELTPLAGKGTNRIEEALAARMDGLHKYNKDNKTVCQRNYLLHSDWLGGTAEAS